MDDVRQAPGDLWQGCKRKNILKCPVCGSTLLARDNDKIVCLQRGSDTEFCKGELPCRRRDDQKIPELEKGGLV
jgi:hypothetical protein